MALKPESVHAAIPLSSVIYWINQGKYDNHMDVLSTTIFERKRTLQRQKGAENLAKLEVGDAIRIVGAVKPKYLKGAIGTVVDHRFPNPKPGWIAIELSQTVSAKFVKGAKVQLPAQLVEYLDS